MQNCGWAVVAIALGLAAACIPAQQTISKAHGTTLAGKAVSLPDAMCGKVGVLVVGFSKSSQRQVAAWGRRLSADLNNSSSWFPSRCLCSLERLEYCAE